LVAPQHRWSQRPQSVLHRPRATPIAATRQNLIQQQPDQGRKTEQNQSTPNTIRKC
jgi:hypothetical protein